MLHLIAKQPVAVVSDAKLVTDVASFKKPPAVAPKGFTPLPSSPAFIDVSPLALLRELSVAYSPPGIPMFWLASKWGVLRYMWIFDAAHATHGLRLSPLVDAIPRRLKASLAEDLGVALTRLITPELLNVGASTPHRWVDGEIALATKTAGPFSLTPRNGPHAGPDLFLLIDSAPGTVTPWGVEAKGTTGNKWSTQMRHASVQLQSVALNVPGGPATPPAGLAVSTELTTSAVTVRALDPAGDWSGPVAPRRAPNDSTVQPRTRFTPKDGRTLVEDPDEFRRDLVDLADAQLLTYAGQFKDAARLLPTRLQSTDTDVPNSTENVRTTNRGDFIGTEVVGQGPDGTVMQVFYGLELDLARALAAPEQGPSDAGRLRVATVAAQNQTEEASDEAANDTRSVVSYGADGTLLQISMEPANH